MVGWITLEQQCKEVLAVACQTDVKNLSKPFLFLTDSQRDKGGLHVLVLTLCRELSLSALCLIACFDF